MAGSHFDKFQSFLDGVASTMIDVFDGQEMEQSMSGDHNGKYGDLTLKTTDGYVLRLTLEMRKS